MSYLLKFIDLEIFKELNGHNQKSVLKAERGNEDSLVYVSSSFLIGKNDFPKNKEIGIKYLMYGTNLNLPKVKEQYGTHLLLGEAISKDEEKGIKLLHEAALSQKDADKLLFLANHILADESYDINSTAKYSINYVLAKQILKESADMGNAKAMFQYGLICKKNKKNKYGEIQSNIKEAFKYLQMSSKKGDPEGMIYYADFIADGLGGAEKNLKEAQKLYKNSYEKGCLDGCAAYGETLISERFENLNIAEGLRLIKYAFENGSLIGLCAVANYYRYGLNSFEKDEEKALNYYKMAVEKNNSAALLHIGDFYKDGNVVEKDLLMAYKYYLNSYENGQIFAAARLGDLYSDKNLEDFYDLKRAQKYYKYAVDAGIIDNLHDYCFALANDDKNLENNKSELMEYLRLGVEIKDCETMGIYAALLFDGDKIRQNCVRSVALFKECAQMGDEFAIKELIEIYENGQGTIHRDLKEAQKYRKMLEEKETKETKETTVESKCCLLL